MDEYGKGGALDREQVQKMILKEVAPLKRQVSSKRINRLIDARVDPLEARVKQVERDSALAIAGYELMKEFVGENFAKLDTKLDAQHADIVGRMGKVEVWQTNRTRVETLLMRLSQLAAVAALKRWIGFVALVGCVLGMTWVIYSILGG